MHVLCWGNDPRYQILSKELRKKYDVDLIADLNVDIKKYDIIVLPMKGVSDSDFLNLLKESKETVTIYTGVVGKLCDINRQVVSFLDDDEIRNQNDDLTVDGIMDYLNNIKYQKVCILGFGHIGRKLYNKLIDYKDVMVGVILKNDKEELMEYGFYTTDVNRMANVFNNSDIIINTVPAHIISNRISENLQTPILDIASYPHGIDSSIVQKNKLDYYLYLGIPGKYNPDMAGKILLKKFI